MISPPQKKVRKIKMGDEECDVKLVNTNGIVTSFYELMWKKKNERQEKQSKFPNFFVYLPDTIVYNFSQPQYWYFTSSRSASGFRRLVKKKRQNLNSKNILEKFLKTKSKSGIVAVYMYKDETPEGRARVRAGGSTVCIRYLNADGLKANLLRLGQFNDNGVLQQFIEPKPLVDGSLRNHIIQATWQPNHISFDKRQNKHLLTDERHSYQQRAETFEGTFENSEPFPMVSGILLEEITSICNRIAEHLWHVADCTVKRMVLNFRIDEANKVWFLFCSHVSVIDRDTIARSPAELLLAVGPKQKKELLILPSSVVEARAQQRARKASQQQHLEDQDFGEESARSVTRPKPRTLPPLVVDSPLSSSQSSTTRAFRPSATEQQPLQPSSPSNKRHHLHPPGGSTAAGASPGLTTVKHASYLKESFTDLGWGASAESVKRIVFDNQNYLSPSQR